MLQTLLNGGGSLPVAIGIFAVTAFVVWRAGTRLAGYADRLAKATGLSGALIGLLVLGGVTSLPEITTSATAAAGGAGALAANNLIGGVALQLMALAIADAVVGREALTSIVPRPDVLAYAAMNVALLTLMAGLISAGDVEIAGSGLGVGAVLVAGAYVVCLLSARTIGRRATWRPVDARPGRDADAPPPPEQAADEGESRLRLALLIAGSGALITVGGFLLARSGELIAERSGLGQSFFGAVFLGGATSLPEFSSAIAAVRLGRPQMAVGDVLGGNLFNLSLILLVDAVYGPPVLAELGAFSVVAACLGALLCAILIVGIVERRDRSIWRLGYDSAAMIAVYAAGLVLLYSLRGGG
ncbi:MAG: sodium:calcium antiporter [Phenylobacterium sp.]|uniref:sodium:calcium antiporter n=1 Tax=Phenylobacterium sp. TaxID=1871053 RepID=UPI00391A0CA2